MAMGSLGRFVASPLVAAAAFLSRADTALAPMARPATKYAIIYTLRCV